MLKKKIFLASPFFNDRERDFNKKTAVTLRKNGFEVWLAQEAPFIKNGTMEEKRKLFDIDISALKSSDVVVAILDGLEVDSGTAFEIGYASALDKPVIALKTDYRTFSKIENINLMLEVPLVKLCKDIDEIIKTLKKLKRDRGSE